MKRTNNLSRCVPQSKIVCLGPENSPLRHIREHMGVEIFTASYRRLIKEESEILLGDSVSPGLPTGSTPLRRGQAKRIATATDDYAP